MSDDSGYRIDYDDLDVEDLVAQIRRRVRSGESSLADGGEHDLEPERQTARLRTWLEVDDDGVAGLRRELGLRGEWNVAPEDLRASHPNLLGRLIAGLRRLGRPLVKLLVNADLPLYKQHKLNLGLAAAIRELLQENAELRGRVERLSERLDRLEGADPEGRAGGTPRDPRP